MDTLTGLVGRLKPVGFLVFREMPFKGLVKYPTIVDNPMWAWLNNVFACKLYICMRHSGIEIHGGERESNYNFVWCDYQPPFSVILRQFAAIIISMLSHFTFNYLQ